MSRLVTTAGLIALISIFAAGCGDGAATGADAMPPEGELVIEPADVELLVENGGAEEQAYTVTLVDDDGGERDVTAEVALRVEDIGLGSFTGSVFRTSGVAAGHSTVIATLGDLSASAAITVRLSYERVVPPAAAEAPAWFGSAAEDSALAPQIVYPEGGTVVPRNLGDFEAHWIPAAGTDLFELTLRHELAEVRIYTVGEPGVSGLFAALSVDEWRSVASAAAGGAASMELRAMATASPDLVGRAPSLEIGVSAEEVAGGLYYWASTGARPGGIYRHDMGNVGEQAEAFYTVDDTPVDGGGNGRCVACHVLSRDGSKMAVTYDGGNGASTVLDVASRTPMIDVAAGQAWNFASFEPGGERILTVHGGAMVLRNVADASVVATVPADGWVTQPDFSPAGDALVYTAVATPSNDWTFTGGTIVTRSYDAATASFGTPQTLVSEPGFNTYYPSFSPGGDWVLFNRSSEDAYDDGTAELYAVPTDASLAPQPLVAPNLAGGLTNSWARWAPFAQTVPREGGGTEPLYWFTFSSKRAFGVRLAAGQPQLWMAPFYPERAAAGLPASAPAFRLPFQELGTNNHIAQWTEQVIPIE